MSQSTTRTVDVRGPRSAARVTGAVLAVGATGPLPGAPVLGAVATGLALVAALLDAATGSRLGCELHLTVRRVVPARNA